MWRCFVQEKKWFNTTHEAAMLCYVCVTLTNLWAKGMRVIPELQTMLSGCSILIHQHCYISSILYLFLLTAKLRIQPLDDSTKKVATYVTATLELKVWDLASMMYLVTEEINYLLHRLDQLTFFYTKRFYNCATIALFQQIRSGRVDDNQQ